MNELDEYLAELKPYLESQARAICNIDFIDDDPVQFPRRFTKLQDIEIVSFTTAAISWGKRTMICNDANKMLALMDNDPYAYVMDKGYEELGSKNVHRTFFEPDLAYMLRGYHHIYEQYDSIDAMLTANNVHNAEFPAWEIARLMQQYMADANDGKYNSQAVPTHLESTALKRINMALRWLVRNDGIVDLGVWKCITPAQLYVPLDVHVGNTARDLGMTTRNANDKKTVIEITDILRKMRPDDPVFYDYALFGIGVNGKEVKQMLHSK